MKKLLLICLAIAACNGPTGPNGTAGENGQDGSQGPVGPPGPTGQDGVSVASTRYCVATSKAIGACERTYTYQTVTYTNGDKLLLCSVSNRESTASRDFYCRAGSTTCSCALVFDIDSSSAGTMQFQEGLAAPSVVYLDPSSGANGQSVQFDPAKCVN